MPQVILYIAATLDGFIATLDGNLEWLKPFENSGDDFGYENFYKNVETILLGAKTYEQVLKFGEWSYPGIESFVFTSKELSSPNQTNSITFTKQNPAEIIPKIKQSTKQDIWLVGGGKLVSSFLNENLVDKIILSTIPIILGQGIALFPGITKQINLKLIDSRQFSMGVVQTTYILEK